MIPLISFSVYPGGFHNQKSAKTTDKKQKSPDSARHQFSQKKHLVFPDFILYLVEKCLCPPGL